jgi:hypothetical protein
MECREKCTIQDANGTLTRSSAAVREWREIDYVPDQGRHHHKHQTVDKFLYRKDRRPQRRGDAFVDTVLKQRGLVMFLSVDRRIDNRLIEGLYGIGPVTSTNWQAWRDAGEVLGDRP